MLKSIQISNFKCFKELSVEGLKRINVLVGTNNSGKTALLEAVHLLTSGDPAASLRELLVRRGLIDIQMERSAALAVPIDGMPRMIEAPPVEVRLLFHRGQGKPSDALSVKGRASSGRNVSVEASLTNSGSPGPCGLKVLVGDKPADFTPERLLFQSIVNAAGYAGSKLVRYMPALPLHMETLGIWHDWVQESGERSRVVEVMNTVAHPVIAEMFFATPGPMRPVPRSIIRVRLANDDPQAGTWPLAALGEGSYRMLAISLAMLSAGKGGVVLIDEIDTGLHYTVLPKTWQAVHAMAEQRDVQLFATTHSKDCLEAIVQAVRERPELKGDVAVVKLAPGAKQATVFDVDELETLLRIGNADVRGFGTAPIAQATSAVEAPNQHVARKPSRQSRREEASRKSSKGTKVGA